MRFSCHSCTACCRSFDIAVTPAEVDRIGQFDWNAHAARFAGGWVESGILRKVEGGACVFLDPDGLCAIHRRLGVEAKPDLCRMFPLAPVRSPDGHIEVFVVPECESWHRSWRTGAPAEASLPVPVPDRLLTIAPPALPLRPGGPFLLWADVRTLVVGLGAAIGAAASAEAALAAFPPALREAEARHARALSARRAAAPVPSPALSREEALSVAVDLVERFLPGRAVPFSVLPGESLAFFLAVLRAWVEGPLLAQARADISAVLGALAACAHLLPDPEPGAINRRAKEIGVRLRSGILPELLQRGGAAFRALATLDAKP